MSEQAYERQGFESESVPEPVAVPAGAEEGASGGGWEGAGEFEQAPGVVPR